MDDAELESLQQLLISAEPFTAPVGDTMRKPPTRSQSGGVGSPSGVQEGVSAVEFLIAQKTIDLGEYSEWNRSGIAFKNSYGEEGFEAWHVLSASVDNYDGEERCRKEWDAIKERSAGPKLTIATYVAKAKELGWKPPRTSGGQGRLKARGDIRDAERGRDEGTSTGPRRVDPAARAVDLADEAGDEFWLDQEDKAHVSFRMTLPDGCEVVRHAPVLSSVYKAVLAQRYFEDALTKVLSGEHANLAVALLEHRARSSGVRHVAALRVGEHLGKIYVDLGIADGRAVEIDDTDWRIINNPPVRFVRGSRGELPIPERGGKLTDFERHFNLSRDDLIRLLGFLIAVFNASGSYAILLVDGEQGSGKSILNDKNVSLVDPPRQTKSARMSFNAKEQDLHLGALGVHVPYFDNVSSFSADAADALCRMSTGGGSGSRKLYSDDQYNQLVVIRPVVITCIGAPSSRPDLLSRSVRITARPLTGHRRTEKAVMKEFEADRAKMIGFLFSCVSAAIRNRAAVEEAVERGDFQLPRMADFAEFVEGAAEMLGLKLGQFSALIDDGQSAMQTEAVLGHPVGAALLKHFSRVGRDPLVGTAREILSLLRDLLPLERQWPAANMFRKALSRMAVGLRALGVEWEVARAEGHENVARFKIWTTDRFDPTAVADSEHDDTTSHF
jgi:hypothetical protein